MKILIDIRYGREIAVDKAIFYTDADERGHKPWEVRAQETYADGDTLELALRSLAEKVHAVEQDRIWQENQ